MVVKMMKWRPWPPLQSKKFEAKITIHELRGILGSPNLPDYSGFSVEIKWKGSKGISLTSLRKDVRRNFTKEEMLGEDGIVRWGEEFRCFGSFSGYKDGSFHPWEVSFAVFSGLKQGTASLNLSDFASTVEMQGQQVSIPLLIPGAGLAVESNTSLHLSVVLLESRNVNELPDPSPRPILLFPRSPCYGEMFSTEKEAVSTVKTSPRRMNIFKVLSPLRGKREEEGSDGRSSDVEYNYPVDSDSQDDSEELDEDSRAENSSGYGTLAYANHVRSLSLTNTSSNEDEGWVYYSHHTRASAGPDHTTNQDTNTKRRLLPWRKRKLSFRSPKVKVKGEPLLKKYYGEEGGDDIDFDRRQLSSSDESTFRIANEASVSAFGDDNFAVGIWEEKEITSRDGQLKLKTQVFFASIDQRSERADGESACTALVAVIADWLQSNNDEMPIKSQLDSLIREGSLEWRNLCENETYKERFPDKHFDLETVVEAQVRPLSVVPEKSFVGFFHPEGLEDEKFDFLQGAMSFDNIWDEICQSPSGVYIISWNDHFFVLKVEEDAYYMIDTLGERLYEGCNQAFILKFDKDTVINQVADVAQKSDDKPRDEKNESSTVKQEVEDEPGVVCSGKESCKEYIKSFLAAIPIRELQGDLKKGLIASTLLHHRLQIEFHYTKEVEDNEEEGSSPLEPLD
ncbi:hypothetical protein ACS0TY_000811 [Phlomoides rotata]